MGQIRVKYVYIGVNISLRTMHLSFLSFKYSAPSAVLRSYYITAIIMSKIEKYQQEISSTVRCKIFQKITSEDCYESMKFILDLSLQNDCSLLDIKRKVNISGVFAVRSKSSVTMTCD